MYLEEFIYMMNNEGRKADRNNNEEADGIKDDVKIYIRNDAQGNKNEFPDFVRKYERRLKSITS